MQLILEQIRRAQANVHNVGIYRKTHQHGDVSDAYVRDALKLARGQCLEAAALIDGELQAVTTPGDERPLLSKREEATRALYIRAATTSCAASVTRKERDLEEAEFDNDAEAIEIARGALEKAHALLADARRLAGENFDMTANLAEDK